MLEPLWSGQVRVPLIPLVHGPFNLADVMVMVLLTATAFIIGLYFYSRCCRKRKCEARG